MKRHELIDHLQRQGCRLDREGSRHTIYINPANGAKRRCRVMSKSTIG